MVAGRRSFCMGSMPYDCGSHHTSSPNVESSPNEAGGYFPSIMNNIVSPFINCWQPPIATCVTPNRPVRTGSSSTSQQRPTAISSSLQLPEHPQQKSNIREPHANDVLCGRGGSSNRHVGNLNFRCLVAANKEMYVTLTKKQKMMVARKIVETIHMQDPPGRFLQKDSHTGLWFDIGIPRSLEKTSQALREKNTGFSSISSQSSKSPNHAITPVSPGGSSVTAITALTEETYSTFGIADSPISTKSSSVSPLASLSGTASSSPVSSSKNDSVSANEVPSISIPEHLETQFHPPRRVEHHHSAHLPPRWNYEYPPIPPPVRSHPPYPQPPPSYYPPHPPPPTRDYYRQHHHPPPPPPHYPSTYPLPPLDHHDYRPHCGQPQPYSRLPPSKYLSSSVNRVPPSPQSKGLNNGSRYSTPDRALYINSREEILSSDKGNGGRQSAEISPNRAQVWKKRRTADEPTLLTHELGNRLSIQDNKVKLRSPSGILQSRSQRGVGALKGDDSLLSGLAALSSAALLKLDEGGNHLKNV
mmetsp:Transcript_26856/g.30691  ORF Transcript_26856/g.30691 Transcript_26856/m.30691 type:complete len:529 (-) Transcript_26856:48-1634(-)